MNQTNFEYGSFGRRVVAYILDALILAVPATIIGSIIPVLGGLIAWFFYAPVLEASELRATLGKYLMGLQVTDLAGGRISFRASVVRNLLKFITAVFLCIGFLVALFTKRRQTIHDILADTLVVRGRMESVSIPDAWSDSCKAVFTFGAMKEAFSRSENAGAGTFTSELERLQALKEKGALTEEEFARAKAKLLGEEKT